MTIAPVKSSHDLSLLVEDLREHTEVESMVVVEESKLRMTKEQWDCKKHTIPSLRSQENMQEWLRQPLKRAEEDYRSLIM